MRLVSTNEPLRFSVKMRKSNTSISCGMGWFIALQIDGVHQHQMKRRDKESRRRKTQPIVGF